MKPILEINSLSKKYLLGERERYLSIRDFLSNPLGGFIDRFQSKAKRNNSFWALQDISFDVFSGESVGIVGKNGAGKSTLLKILSRITPPTKGSIKSRGRIASLLEVGTGFHPELTGRENIFMNGSILGMRRSDIKNHFDEIVDFSGVERFIDTPLKKYSSGMQLRLAFAVAAHLEPEILIIDEVLAVGDAEFQKKCLGKMGQISEGGRTVLFVSHDITAIRALTKTCLLLEGGLKMSYGLTDSVLDLYMIKEIARTDNLSFTGKNSKLSNARLIDVNGKPISVYDIQDEIRIEFIIDKKYGGFLSLEFFLKDYHQNKVAIASLNHFENLMLPEAEGTYHCEVKLKNLYLASGQYFIDIAVSQPNIDWDLYADNAVSFEVHTCNPRKFSWDLKQEYRYGNIAWLLAEKPKFTLNESGTEHRRTNN